LEIQDGVEKKTTPSNLRSKFANRRIEERQVNIDPLSSNAGLYLVSPGQAAFGKRFSDHRSSNCQALIAHND
jgi:NADP-dependent 3-hydroxy acid dehydrogenase YdfG